MAKRADPTDQPDEMVLLGLCRAIAAGDGTEVARALDASPGLATATVSGGATRQDPDTYFLTAIRHHVYAGDTALHIAAAAYQPATVKSLLAKGAPVRARNRRGAEPLHYAADGSPGAAWWDPRGQRSVIEYLISKGADPDALDKSGVAALHRAVRTRSSDAVRALLENGATLKLMNNHGSTPLHLAVQNTGRSNSGSDAAKDEQRKVIAVLLQRGATPSDTDAKGKTVAAAAGSDWVRELLEAPH